MSNATLKKVSIGTFIIGRKYIFVLCIIVSIFSTVVSILISSIIRNITDSGISNNLDGVYRNIYIFTGVLLAGAILTYTGKYLSARFGTLISRDIRSRVYDHIEKSSMAAVERRHSGEILNDVNNSILAIHNFIENDLTNLIYQPLLFLGALVFMLLINWKLALFSNLLMPMAIVLGMVIIRPIEKYSSYYYGFLGKLNGLVKDVISGIYILKAYNLETPLSKKFEDVNKSVSDKAIELEKRQRFLGPVNILLRLVPFIFCMLFGGYLTIQKQITPGELLAFIQLLNYIVGPASMLPNVMVNMKKAMGACRSLFVLLNEPLERADGKVLDSEALISTVQFNNITFGYNEEIKVLNNLNLTLESGKTTALVGCSGSGKSTIIKLLCGFYSPCDGHIKIFGEDYADLSLNEIRSKISLISQEPFLFPVSIEENISYGKPGASREEIIAASKAAYAHDFINELPEGYSTKAGEQGCRLSGGQKQRIAIARAILKDSPILLMDEPTSALDSESETLIQQALKSFIVGRTVLIIAHRLSTIRNADEIIVLENGEIAESGTQNELADKNGLYKNLFVKNRL